MLKNKYKSDYQTISRMDARGRIVQDYYYTGDYYRLPLDENGRKRTRIANFVFGIGMFLMLLAAGFINQDSSRTIWILMPYFCLFLPCAYMLIGAGSYWGAPVRMEHAVYNGTIIRMQRSCWGIIVVSAVNVVLDLVFIGLYHSTIQIGKECIYCALLGAVCVTGIAFGKYFDKVYTPVTRERNQ